jgi:hypothetical protein
MISGIENERSPTISPITPHIKAFRACPILLVSPLAVKKVNPAITNIKIERPINIGQINASKATITPQRLVTIGGRAGGKAGLIVTAEDKAGNSKLTDAAKLINFLLIKVSYL